MASAAIGRRRPASACELPAGSDQTIWFNPDAFAAGDVGTFGTVGKGAYFGPGTYSWDMGLSRNIRLKDEMNIQFRAEFFNIFNQVNFAGPATAVNGAALGTNHQHPRKPG
jgi:hypothetical protein